MDSRYALDASHAAKRLGALPADPLEAVEELVRVRELVDRALNEAMAEATIAGASMREVAARAGLAPNSVPPRLARSLLLAPYAADGWVTSSSIERARYDSETGRPASQAVPARKPLSFQRRRSTTSPQQDRA